jgi:hypothetical protein
MALYSELPVYKSTYDLLLGIFQFTKDFGKEYKYTVGESLKKETIELLTLIYRANVKRDKQEVLQEAPPLRSFHLNKLEFFVNSNFLIIFKNFTNMTCN